MGVEFVVFCRFLNVLGVLFGPIRPLLAPIGPYWRPMVETSGTPVGPSKKIGFLGCLTRALGVPGAPGGRPGPSLGVW